MQELAFPRRKGIFAPVSVLVLLILPLVDLPSANGESPTNGSGVCLRANTYMGVRSSSECVCMLTVFDNARTMREQQIITSIRSYECPWTPLCRLHLAYRPYRDVYCHLKEC